MSEKINTLDLTPLAPQLGEYQFHDINEHTLALADRLVQDGDEQVELPVPANPNDVEMVWSTLTSRILPTDPRHRVKGGRVVYDQWHRPADADSAQPFEVVAGGYLPRGSKGVPLQVTLVRTSAQAPEGPRTNSMTLHMGVPETLRPYVRSAKQ